MSNQNQEPIPTNEEVIKEITKDLEEQDINKQTADTVAPVSDNQCSSSDLQDNITSNNCIPEDFEKSDSDGESVVKPSVFNDYIDEKQLEELNATLTEEQKQERRHQASELKKEGNASHKDGQYREAIGHYTEALRLCPLEDKNDRSILYSNRAASKIQLLDYKESALEDCSKALELNPNYIRAYLRRAKLYEETEKLDESLEDYKKVLEFDPGNKDALKATVRLPPLINERNEKLKTEMMGKLKDLGNMILRPFGLSTENFKMQQDPSTGSYSVNFQQNSK